MSDSKKLYILGYSGHAYVVIDAAAGTGLITSAYLDISEAERNPYQLAYAGNENNLTGEIPDDVYFFPAVGDNALRKKLADLIAQKSWKEISITHKSAVVSDKAVISSLVLISPLAVVNSMAHIGRASVINTSAVVEHECEVGNYTHIGPGAVLLGAVKTGESCLIGAGSVVLPGIQIGDNVTIGAGSVVTKNIPSGTTWLGNPARIQRK